MAGLQTETFYFQNNIQNIIEAVVTNNLGYERDEDLIFNNDTGFSKYVVDMTNLKNHLMKMDSTRKVLTRWDEESRKMPIFTRFESAICYFRGQT